MNAHSKPETSHPDSQDLHWLAFLYVADEMDAEQRSAFEGRMADDAAACQAVAQAVSLARCIDQSCQDAVGPVEVARKTATGSGLRQPWFALATTAALMFVIGAGWWLLPPTETPEAQSDALADAWVNTLVDLDQEQFEELVSEEVAVGLAYEETDDWMLAALYEMESDIEQEMNPDSLDHEEAPQQCVD